MKQLLALGLLLTTLTSTTYSQSDPEYAANAEYNYAYEMMGACDSQAGELFTSWMDLGDFYTSNSNRYEDVMTPNDTGTYNGHMFQANGYLESAGVNYDLSRQKWYEGAEWLTDALEALSNSQWTNAYSFAVEARNKFNAAYDCLWAMSADLYYANQKLELADSMLDSYGL